MSKISIIIPILNEAKTIGVLLQHLLENSTLKNISEIIIVDGGSTDNSKANIDGFVTSSDSNVSFSAIKNDFESYREVNNRKSPDTLLQSKNTRPDIQLIKSYKGRARQMNYGAKHASGDILYFLHADSLPPKYFDQRIINEVSQGNTTGCFRMKFDKPTPVLRFSQWFTRFNFKVCRGGDQSLYITREIFNNLKGFNEAFGVYEDCEIIGRIYKNYKFNIINDYVITSARRYERNGSWRLQYHFTVIHLKKWLGASAEELNLYYERHIV
jgi:glycosyltransferase involved in cell wall biosynthesis